MNLDNFYVLITFLIALSLAVERIVLIIRTPIGWLNEEKQDNRLLEGLRKLLVLLITLAASIVTTGFLAGDGWSLYETLNIGSAEHPFRIPFTVIAILAMGGSSFWKNILGYTKAVRDLRTETRRQLAAGKLNTM